MKTNLSKLGLIALAVGALAPLANAQTINNGNPTGGPYTPGDLFVGFYDSGNSQEYSLDLGPVSAFNLSTSFEIPNSSTLMAADLATQFGGTWATASNVYFGLISTPDTADTYITDPVGNAAWSAAGTEGTPESDLIDFGNTYYDGSGIADGQTSQGTLEGTGVQYSWYSFAHSGFGEFTDLGLQYGDKYISSLTSGTSNFDELSSTAGETTLGTWTVDSSGDLFYAAAVPEPSTIGTVLFGAAALVGFRFRRRA